MPNTMINIRLYIKLLILIPIFAVTLSAQDVDDVEPYWIFFVDKGAAHTTLERSALDISFRTLKRRAKVRPDSALLDISDRKVYNPYVDAIRPYVERIRVRSRWLNAVSANIKREHIPLLRQLACVRHIQPVARKNHPLPPQPDTKLIKGREPGVTRKAADLDYGPSQTQLEQIGVPFLHERGFYGDGVVVAMLDDGFNLLTNHRAFRHLNVLDTYDFIHDDQSVDDSGLKANEGWHGTMTLSTIAGYVPGALIGPAFEAQYLLAKTEENGSETEAEEDYWVAGLEWAERRGADIVSSSVGYIDWYSYEDMDGETAVTTVAADMAFSKGLAIFNSAGNEGFNKNHNTLIAPADGDHVIAVAAVTADGTRASFSSVGPSYDRRIKPDIAAMGASVVTASYRDTSGFRRANGTSFSCPLAAGAAAALLSAYPKLSAPEIYKVLKRSASRANDPDNLLGYGIVNIEKAFYIADTMAFKEKIRIPEGEFIYLAQNFPNPFNSVTTIRFRIKKESLVGLHLYDLSGRRIETLYKGFHDASTFERTYRLGRFSSGLYVYVLSVKDLQTGLEYRKAKKLILLK